MMPTRCLLFVVGLVVASLFGCDKTNKDTSTPTTVSNTNPSSQEHSQTTIAQQVAKTITMVDIPAGTFTMGTESNVGFQNGWPPQTVTVPAFRLSTTEITFAQYDAFAQATNLALPPDEGWGRDSRPVIHVSWADAQAFIAWLNDNTGRRFRLPSEAEWEYAARGGATTLYWWGDKVNHASVNNSVSKGNEQWEFTAPVGQLPANPFGLYDILGNVWELVADCRHANYEGAPNDGSAWMDGECNSHVLRGGSWGSTSRGVQAAARAAAGEHFASMDIGFRLAETPVASR